MFRAVKVWLCFPFQVIDDLVKEVQELHKSIVILHHSLGDPYNTIFPDVLLRQPKYCPPFSPSCSFSCSRMGETANSEVYTGGPRLTPGRLATAQSYGRWKGCKVEFLPLNQEAHDDVNKIQPLGHLTHLYDSRSVPGGVCVSRNPLLPPSLRTTCSYDLDSSFRRLPSSPAWPCDDILGAQHFSPLLPFLVSSSPTLFHTTPFQRSGCPAVPLVNCPHCQEVSP
ncbi:hypothetical protein L345_16146, partial [Ophiophagus hannah]